MEVAAHGMGEALLLTAEKKPDLGGPLGRRTGRGVLGESQEEESPFFELGHHPGEGGHIDDGNMFVPPTGDADHGRRGVKGALYRDQ